MLYCSYCLKDVEFKSLDVGGELTHYCSQCGETSLFKNEYDFELTANAILQEKTRQLEDNISKAFDDAGFSDDLDAPIEFKEIDEKTYKDLTSPLRMIGLMIASVALAAVAIIIVGFVMNVFDS